MSRTRQSGPRRLGLTREQIVAAAGRLVDREGADSLSARRLAEELGCQAMSLYHHVESMGDLLDDVVDAALGTIVLPAPDPAAAWSQLEGMARAFLALAHSRPHVIQVIATHRWHTPAEVAYQGRILELLMAAGLDAREALRGARLVVVYLNGAATALAGWSQDRSKRALDGAPEPMRKLARHSNPRAVALDIEWGLQLVLRSLESTARGRRRLRLESRSLPRGRSAR